MLFEFANLRSRGSGLPGLRCCRSRMVKSVGLALLLFFCTVAVFAKEYRLSLSDAVGRALDSSLLLQAQDLRLSALKRSRNYAWNSLLPRAGLSGTLSRLNQPPVPSADHWNLSAGFSAQLQLSLALFDGIRGMALEYEAGLIDRRTAEARLRRDVKKSYYNLIMLRESGRILELSLETARKRYEQARRNLEAGIGSQFDLLSAQVAWENLKPSREDLRIGYQTAEMAFKQLLGLKAEDAMVLTDLLQVTVVELDARALIREQVSRRLDIQALRQAIALQKNARNMQRNATYTPLLSLSYTFDPMFSGDPFREPLFDDPRNDWTQPTGMVAVNLSLPLDALLPFSPAALRIANMQDGIEEMEKTLAWSIQGAELEIESLVLQLQKARASLEVLQLNVQLAERAYEQAERGFATGALEPLQLADADNELSKARHQVLREKHSYITTLLDLEYAINQSLF
jgi:multidrug efflux system outer membrane protein